MGAPAIPAVAAIVGSLHIKELIWDGLDALLGFEPGRAWLQETAEKVVPGLTSAYTGFLLETRADFMLRLVTALLAAEEHVNPKLAQLAALGLQDYFGVAVNPGALVGHGGPMSRADALRPLSDALMQALFGAFRSESQGSPQAGYDSMLRLVDNQLFVAVAGWLRENLGLGIITKELPGWGDLHHIVAGALGFGRVTARCLRPIIDGLIVEPARQKVASTYLNAIPSEAQAVRLKHRGVIFEGEFYDIMARHGWRHDIAAEMLLGTTTLPSRSDLRAMLDDGSIDVAQVGNYLIAAGYAPEVAAALRDSIENDRIRALHGSLAQLARDMLRDRELSEGEARGLLSTAGYSLAEQELLLAVALIERSRPKRLSIAAMEEMYNRGFVELAELSAFYTHEGYSERDVSLLEQRAAEQKIEFEAKAAARRVRPPAESPGAVPRDVALEANRRGILSPEQLKAVLEGQGLKGLALDTELRVAADRRREFLDALARRVPPSRGVTTSAGPIEDAYVRNIVSDAQLQAFYASRGFVGEQLSVLLQLRAAERAEFIARAARAAAVAIASPTTARA